MPEEKGKQNPKEPYTDKYQIYISCSYGHKLACVDDKLSKLFKTHLGKDPVYNYINSMMVENKYHSEVMKKRLTINIELVMTKEYNEDFNLTLNLGSVTMIQLIMILK